MAQISAPPYVQAEWWHRYPRHLMHRMNGGADICITLCTGWIVAQILAPLGKCIWRVAQKPRHAPRLLIGWRTWKIARFHLSQQSTMKKKKTNEEFKQKRLNHKSKSTSLGINIKDSFEQTIEETAFTINDSYSNIEIDLKIYYKIILIMKELMKKMQTILIYSSISCKLKNRPIIQNLAVNLTTMLKCEKNKKK